ncbi:MAG TPA: hypothetical protein H9671_08350, partial [Firmicutes bacterium]|nr:hypothetical protein [Bacillota bacterium]
MKKWRSVFFVCLVLMLLTLQVSADMGPKPRLTITVTNPPQEPYYLDLLVQNEGGYEPELDPQEYQASMLEDLRSLESEGWYPAYSGGHTY